jgi:nitrous oxide reductase accessory protein NosL
MIYIVTNGSYNDLVAAFSDKEEAERFRSRYGYHHLKTIEMDKYVTKHANIVKDGEVNGYYFIRTQDGA